MMRRSAATGLPHLHSAGALATSSPLVSICITALNRERYIDAAIESALGQTYDRLDVVVVDDASTDSTADRVRAYEDPRLRLFVNGRTLGQSANRNRALMLARGEVIKFLDSDDRLAPDCVAMMVQVFVDEPTVGLVFCRSQIAVDEAASSEPGRPSGAAPVGFREVHALNDGRVLLGEMLAGGFHNWIGAPSAVMVRRAHLERSGGFSYKVKMQLDLDLWARLLAHAMVGFVDDELATYRYLGGESETVLFQRTRRDWTDRLWMLEGLACDPETREAYPIDDMLRLERRGAYRTALRLGWPAYESAQRLPIAPYLKYAGFRCLSKMGRPPDLFASLPRAPDERTVGR